MRFRQVLSTARFLAMFFTRRVLRVGVLRHKPARYGALAALGVFIIMLCASAYYYLNSFADDHETWALLFDIATISVLMWVQVAFILVKFLFANAESMLELTWHLPITNRERSAAFLLYEATMTGIIGCAGVGALIVSSLLILGPAALGPIAVSIVLPAGAAYLVLTVFYQAMLRLWTFVRLGRVASVLSILGCFGLLAAYFSMIDQAVAVLTSRFLDGGNTFLAYTAIAQTFDYFSWPIALLLVLAGFGVTGALGIALTPNRHLRQAGYVHLRLGPCKRLTGPYDLALLRSANTLTTVSLAVAVFVYLLFDPIAVNPMWASGIIAFAGVYLYPATASLRQTPSAGEPAWKVYLRLVKATALPVTVFVLVTLPVTLWVAPYGSSHVWTPIATALTGVVLTVAIGVVVPAEKDNPLAVLIGLTLFATVAGLIAVAAGFMNLPENITPIMFIFGAMVTALYSVAAIDLDMRKARHEKGTPGGQLHRRRHHADGGDDRGRESDPHVHQPI